jgi:hypothetical protein
MNYPTSTLLKEIGEAIGLFEREGQGPGWDVFGNQVENSIPGPDFNSPAKKNRRASAKIRGKWRKS